MNIYFSFFVAKFRNCALEPTNEQKYMQLSNELSSPSTSKKLTSHRRRLTKHSLSQIVNKPPTYRSQRTARRMSINRSVRLARSSLTPYHRRSSFQRFSFLSDPLIDRSSRGGPDRLDFRQKIEISPRRLASAASPRRFPFKCEREHRPE